MHEAAITQTPDHLLVGDIASLEKEQLNSMLRGLLAYEMRAHLNSEHQILHPYLGKLQSRRLDVATRFVALGGEVSPVVLLVTLPKWHAEERPSIASLVKTKGHQIYSA